MHATRCKLFLMLAGIVSLGSDSALAQFVDPMECLPPAGQAMWEIAASNLARAYRDDPTAANKEKMCIHFRKTIEVYQNAAKGCRRSTCKDVNFKKSCARVNEKVVFWQKRTKEEC